MGGVFMLKYLRVVTALLVICVAFWWGVVFSDLYRPMTDVSVGGFVESESEVQEIPVGFWVVELWGKIQNFFGRG